MLLPVLNLEPTTNEALQLRTLEIEIENCDDIEALKLHCKNLLNLYTTSQRVTRQLVRNTISGGSGGGDEGGGLAVKINQGQ